MNRGAINGYALNAKGVRGTVFRLAADLVAHAVVAARARVLRRLTHPLDLSAAISDVPGRRAVREVVVLAAEAVSVVTALPRLRDVFSAACLAVVALAASVGRRAPIALQAQAQADLSAYATLRGAAAFMAQAQAPTALTAWKLCPTGFVASAAVSLTAGLDNEFPYDEDAPEERVFLVAPEDNIFYVVV